MLSTSFESENLVDSVSYALGQVKTNDFYVQNSKDFKNPLLVEKLPPKTPLTGGTIETIDELPSAEDYYDGTKGLKMTYATCQQYTTQQDACLHQGSCGWCAGNGSCIAGNAAGPLAPCLRGTYKFTAPAADWNPMGSGNYNVNRMNVGGAQLTTFVSK